jgi:catechol 2,3-dioxygenase-like lactoylglutathione lyase family enzyme
VGFALTAWCAQAAEPAPPGPVVRRATLLVADVAKSIDFYQRLGFSVWYDQGGDRDSARPMTLPLNVKPGYSRLVIMKGRDPWIGMIGLLGYDKPKPAPNRSVADKIGLGDVIIMLETDDVPGSYSRLSEIKATIIQPPQSFETKGADGKTMVGMNLFAVDPDGHVIELSQPAR